MPLGRLLAAGCCVRAFCYLYMTTMCALLHELRYLPCVHTRQHAHVIRLSPCLGSAPVHAAHVLQRRWQPCLVELAAALARWCQAYRASAWVQNQEPNQWRAAATSLER